MRGRGIGTARGRATIMRGPVFLLRVGVFTNTPMQPMVPLTPSFEMCTFELICPTARRGRGVPAARGIRR
jgi:hypothetical protein